MRKSLTRCACLLSLRGALNGEAVEHPTQSHPDFDVALLLILLL